MTLPAGAKWDMDGEFRPETGGALLLRNIDAVAYYSCGIDPKG